MTGEMTGEQFEALWAKYRLLRRTNDDFRSLAAKLEGAGTVRYGGARPFFERVGRIATLRVFDDEITVSWKV